MEFHEKLQELRKRKGLTQEELAEALYVSRTAISKWESGRGYPSIDSLKELSEYFSVTIDELLSGEKLISLAEKENKANLRSVCELLFGMVDVCAFLLMVLPLYPNTVEGHIYSVNLFSYAEATRWIRVVYWSMFCGMMVCGIANMLLNKTEMKKWNKVILYISLGLNCFGVVFLALTRAVYAIVIVFLLLVIKGVLLLKGEKARKW